MKIWGAPISHGLCLLGWEALHGVQVQRFRAQPATEPLRRTLVLRTQRANREGPVAPPVFVMTRCHGPPGPRGHGARGPGRVVRAVLQAWFVARVIRRSFLVQTHVREVHDPLRCCNC
jgi:hypothetical protein